MADIPLKRGDTSPSVTTTLTDENDQPVTLSASNVRFHMAHFTTMETKVDAPAEITAAETGDVRYAWDPADTDEPGLYFAEFEVTHTDGSVETFPNDGYITVYIGPDAD